MSCIYCSHCQQEEIQIHIKRMISHLRRLKEATHAQLLKKMYPANSAVFRSCIDTLMLAKLIIRQDHTYVWVGDLADISVIYD